MLYLALGGLNNDRRQMAYYRCTSDSGSLFFFYVSAGRCAMYLGTTSLREMHLRVMTYVLTQCCFLFVYVHFGKAQ